LLTPTSASESVRHDIFWRAFSGRGITARGGWGGGDGGAASWGVGAVDGGSVNAFLGAALTRVMRVTVPVCVCVCMCTCMLERDRENAREGVCVYVCMCACVCGKEREPSCPPASSRGRQRDRETLVRMYTRRKLRPYSALPSNHCTSSYKALRGWTHNIIHWLTRGMNWHRKKAARRDGCHRWRRYHVVRW